MALKPNFPKHVWEVKDHLESSKDKRLDVMRLLTEPRSDGYLIYYEGMWRSLFRAEKKYNEALTNAWVVNFLDAVITAKTPPLYAVMSPGERNKLVKEIVEHTRALAKIYVRHGFNQDVISNDGQFFGGFSSIEEIEDENGTKIIESGRPEKASVVKTLLFFGERARDEIREWGVKGNRSPGVEHRIFVRLLAKRNIELYGGPLFGVLSAAVLAIHGEDFSESRIANLLARLRV